MRAEDGPSCWLAIDPEGEPVAVVATSGAWMKRAGGEALMEIVELGYEGDGVFYVSATDAVADLDEDTAVLRRSVEAGMPTSPAVWSWPITATWRALAAARGMFVWLMVDDDVEAVSDLAIAEVLRDERGEVFIVPARLVT